MRFRLLVLALGTFALGTDTFVIVGILPAIAQQLHVSVDMAGQLVTVFSLTYALGSPILTVLTGTMARRRLLTVSLALFVGANLLAAVASSFALLLTARILAATGAAVFTPTASAAAASLAPVEKRGRALALVTAGMTVSLVLGVPLGILVGSELGWQMTFLLLALLSALALVGVLVFFPPLASPPAIGLRTRLTLLRRPVLLVTLFYSTCGGAGGFTLYTYLGPLLQQRTHLTGAGISSMFLLFGLTSVLGNAIGGYGADRWGTIRTMTISALLVGLALLAFPFAAISFLGTALAIAIWGFAGWLGGPSQQSRLIALAPEVPGEILSLSVSALYFGTASGAALGGLVLHFAPVTLLGPVGSGGYVVALAVLFWSVRLTSKATRRTTHEPLGVEVTPLRADRDLVDSTLPSA